MKTNLLIILITSAFIAVSCISQEESKTVTFTDNGKALINPGMGFCHYAYAGRLWAYGSKNPAWDTMDWFPGCSTVYMRLLWSDIEPEEGVYRWDIIDRYAHPWAAAGKKIAIRIVCCNQTEEACPDFVRTAGANGRWFRYKKHDVGDDFPLRWEPEYDDPVYLEKFGNFLKAFSKRYDGNPCVAFLDVGSFGIYGEGHSEYLFQLQSEDPDEYNRLAIIHLELWRKYFNKTQLIVTDDIKLDNDSNILHPKMARAFELGIGLRDDSVFCHVGTPWHHDAWARKAAEHFPVVIETGHLSALGPDSVSALKDCFQPELLLKCIEENRASYFSIHDFPEIHLKRYQNYIDQINRRLGYRLVPEEISYPAFVSTDEPVVIRSRWKNVGVAPCYNGGKLVWILVDRKNNICWSAVDEKFNIRSLEPTIGGVEQSVDVESSVYFGHTVKNPEPDNCLTWARLTGRDPGEYNVMLSDGKYTLCIAIGDEMGFPTIALPLDSIKDRRIYPVGQIVVKEKNDYL